MEYRYDPQEFIAAWSVDEADVVAIVVVVVGGGGCMEEAWAATEAAYITWRECEGGVGNLKREREEGEGEGDSHMIKLKNMDGWLVTRGTEKGCIKLLVDPVIECKRRKINASEIKKQLKDSHLLCG